MNTKPQINGIDLEERLRRSPGRSVRKRIANARVTEDEYRELDAAARAEGKPLAEWVRDLLLREARRAPDDALFTELVATRLLLVNLLKPMLLGKPMPENWIAEATNGVRTAKHKAAADLRKEYAVRARRDN